MVYSGITACLGTSNPDPDPKEVALRAGMEIMRAIAEDRLLELLEQEARAVIALTQKANRVDELERKVANLEWRAGEAAQNYRQDLADAVLRSQEST